MDIFLEICRWWGFGGIIFILCIIGIGYDELFNEAQPIWGPTNIWDMIAAVFQVILLLVLWPIILALNIFDRFFYIQMDDE